MRVVLILAACALAGCMQLPQAPQTAGTAPPPKRTVPELLALKTRDFTSAQNSQAGEQALREAQLQSARAVLDLPLGPELDAKLPAALEAVALFNAEQPKARDKLLAVLPTLAQKPPALQRAVLSFAHTLFWVDAAPLIQPLLPQLSTPREFAIAAYTVLRADAQAATRQQLRAQLLASFPAWQAEPRLRALERRLSVGAASDLAQRPPLPDLLAAPLRPGYPVVFSFQRLNRERSGLAVVRGADGRFVRNADGSYFSIAQLALARTNLPGTITNGNTPQGVFTVRGTGTAQSNPWIGPTPYLESMLPKEATVAEFEHADMTGDWSEERYASFLPASWRSYFPMWETWLAGQAGRDEILLHGNAINPAYYANDAFYPAPPQAGCMIAMEYWSKADGSLLYSDQLALLKAFASGGRDQGYVVVVELDDRDRPVVLADVVDAMQTAERGIAPATLALLDAELKEVVADPAMPLASLAALVLRDGKVVYQGQFGHRVIDNANPANNQPVTPATLFKVASISKVVTAIGAMRLVEQGKLDLDADISRYLGFTVRNPHFPDAAITTRMLLSHTSSLRDGGGYTFALGPSLRSILDPAGTNYGSGKQWAAPSADGARAPGKYFEYTNLNWGVLGTVMEAASGQRFDRYMKAAVLTPLGIAGHYNAEELTPQEVANVAALYRKRTGDNDWNTQGPWVAQTDDFRGQVPAPRAGLANYVPGSNAIPFSPQSGLRISVAGLGRIMQLLLNEGELEGVRLLQANTVRAMLRDQWQVTPDRRNGDGWASMFNAWGLGLQHFTDQGAPGRGDRLVAQGGVTGYGHIGIAYGLNAAFVVDPQRRLGLVYIIGGVGTDPDKLKGRYSSFKPWEERTMDALYRRAILGDTAVAGQ